MSQQSENGKSRGSIRDRELDLFKDADTVTPLLYQSQLCGHIYLSYQESYECLNSHSRLSPYTSSAPMGIENIGRGVTQFYILKVYL